MAKAAASARLYGKAPKIEPEGDGDLVQSAGGAPMGAAAEAEKTTGAKADMTHGGNAKEDVMAGTDGIPTHHHQHAAERAELHHRHMHEHHEMHHRHEREHLMRVMGHHHEKHHEMHARHQEERRKMHTQHEREQREMHERHEEGATGPTGGITQRSEGKSGTER